MARPKLIDRIERGVEGASRLTLVSAPAGFGKTTLVGQWLASTGRAAAWFSLDEADDDPTRFLEYLAAAVRTVDPGIGRDLLRVLQAPQPTPPMSIMAALVEGIAAADGELVVVLDDFHLITSDVIHAMVGFLLDHQPASMHLVISTRENPPLPLPRLRARAQLTEIDQRDLRFDAEQSRAFVAQTMHVALDTAAVDELHVRTEGWVAGLQLATLALPDDAEGISAFVSRFSGNDRFILDYLTAEALKRLPRDIREFLWQTSVLERLSGPLCDAVTRRSDSQAVLEHLDDANLFIVPLDREREWFRYHRLFAESLRGTLSAEQRQGVHERAMAWHESQGLTRQALEHAITYAELAGSTTHVERLLPVAADEALHVGEVQTVVRWLTPIPEEHVRADARLAAYMGWAHAMSGRLDQAESYALEVERMLDGRASPAPALGLALVLRSYVAILRHQSYDRARELATRALHHLDATQTQWRTMALWSMAEAQERTGHISEAIATLRTAQTTDPEDDQLFAAAIDNFLASALLHHGKRRDAVDVCVRSLRRFTDSAGRVSSLAGIVMSRLGVLYYEANDLGESRVHLDMGLAAGKRLGLAGQLAFAYGAMAPTLHAQGESDAAIDALRQAHRIAESSGLSDSGVFLAAEANLRLAQGDVAFARRWADSLALSTDDRVDYLRFDAQLVYARLLLARGRLDEAGTWLEKLEAFTNERGFARWRLTVHLLQASRAARMGTADFVRDRIESALRIAAPEDFHRAFLDEDSRLLSAVAEAKPHAPAFVEALLNDGRVDVPRRFVPIHPSTGGTIDQDLIEPLTSRELEVLALVAAGYTNRALASKLGIAHGTAKRHTQNIYVKLGVHSRTQAIARARTLGIL